MKYLILILLLMTTSCAQSGGGSAATVGDSRLVGSWTSTDYPCEAALPVGVTVVSYTETIAIDASGTVQTTGSIVTSQNGQQYTSEIGPTTSTGPIPTNVYVVVGDKLEITPPIQSPNCVYPFVYVKQ